MIPPLSLSVILLGTRVTRFCFSATACLSFEPGRMFSHWLASHLLVKAGSVRTLEARFSEMDRGRAG